MVEAKHENGGRIESAFVIAEQSNETFHFYFEEPSPIEGASSLVAAVTLVYNAKADVSRLRKHVFGVTSDYREHFYVFEPDENYRAWLEVCISISQASFSPQLEDRKKAVARVRSWFDYGSDFSPKDVVYIWNAASRWLSWKHKRLLWKECYVELASALMLPIPSEEKLFRAQIDSLQRRCNRAGLIKDW